MKFQASTSPNVLTILIVVICVLFHSSTSKGQNFLLRGSSLSVEDDSDILVSPDTTFSCGFYGLGKNAYWFSIWFTNSKDKTVVWMANRDKPANGKGSRVTLRRDGAMVLTDVDDSIIWETNTTSTDASRAELLNTGNLVLKDLDGKILWQSFDFPTDTLLPNQLLTKSEKLISRLHKASFASGYFSFFFDNDNVMRLIYDGPDISSIYWPDIRFDPFQNRRTKYNSSRIAVFDESGHFVSSDELQFDASDIGFGIKRRLTMDYDGNLRLYSLNNDAGLWVITWQAISQLCDVHGICGQNAICVYTPEPKCSCPPGYEVAEPGNWNKGCKPTFNETLLQSQQVKFARVPHSDFWGFDLTYTQSNISMDSCEKKCVDDYRCKAFSYRLTGEGICFTKSVLFNGYQSPSFPGSLYVKLPAGIATPDFAILNDSNAICQYAEAETTMVPPTYDFNSRRTRWVYLYSFASAVGVIEAIFIASGWWFLLRRKGLPAVLEDGYQVIRNRFRRFTYAELKKATKNFKEELGRGGSGAVYRGALTDERVVAVKRLEYMHHGEEVFWSEVTTIGKINHMNLVRIWGFCSEGKHRLLVYEYMEYQSLDKHLFSPNFLQWKERFKIALGTAKGLAYLHHECLEWVIHCDVKPGNILLDSEFEPKIADFGLAKLFQRGSDNFDFSIIRGTKGYMAPEWATNLPITAKVDVYSYGVVILELVKGIPLSNWIIEGDEQHESDLARFAKLVGRKIESGEESWIEEIVDARLKGEFSRSQAMAMVELGLSCVEEDRNKRPTMDSVVQALLECQDESKIQHFGSQ